MNNSKLFLFFFTLIFLGNMREAGRDKHREQESCDHLGIVHSARVAPRLYNNPEPQWVHYVHYREEDLVLGVYSWKLQSWSSLHKLAGISINQSMSSRQAACWWRVSSPAGIFYFYNLGVSAFVHVLSFSSPGQTGKLVYFHSLKIFPSLS